MKARQIRSQKQKQRGWKLYSWHAPETGCIGKGKAHKPYEFGCKVSITTTNKRCKGGQFILHAKALDKRICLHALRHTAATRAADRGLNTAQIMLVGGWKDYSSAMRYQHPDPSELAKSGLLD